MQEVNFPYEIVIGEDVSSDRTRDIVLSFQTKYPDQIRVILNDPHVAERDRTAGRGGKIGFVNCLSACRGDYVALLDGDDYWTSPHKLQSQANYLDAHADTAICFHNVLIVFQDGSLPPQVSCAPNQKEISTLEDLLRANFISSCATMFRNNLRGNLPDWYQTLDQGDWPLQVLNAEFGNIGYINEVMAAYRVHRQAFWSSRARLRILSRELKAAEAFRRHFRHRHPQILDPIIEHEGISQSKEARICVRRALLQVVGRARVPSLSLCSLTLRLHLPRVHRIIRATTSFIRRCYASLRYRCGRIFSKRLSTLENRSRVMRQPNQNPGE